MKIILSQRPSRCSLILYALFVLGVMSVHTASGQFCSQTGLVNHGDLTSSISAVTQSSSAASGSMHYWTFTGYPGVIYYFGSCGGGEDTYLRIYSGTDSSTASEIASNDDVGPLCSSTSASIAWTCPTRGVYSVLLTKYRCLSLASTQTFTYRYSAPPCLGKPLAGTISVAGGSTACGEAEKPLTLTGYSDSVGNAIQWQSAPAVGSFSSIPGATTPSFLTPRITTTTRYRAILTCVNATRADTAAVVTISVNPNPPVTLSPAVTTVCAGTPTTTTLTAGGANVYTWTPGGVGATNTRSYSPTATTIYEVTGTNTTTGCSTTRRAVIVVGQSVAPSASPAAVCSGGATQLNANISATPDTPGYRLYPTSYSPIATPGSGVTTLASGTQATVTLAGGNLGDGYWPLITVPFTFKYYGISSSRIEISTNGHVQMLDTVNAERLSGANPITTFPNGRYDGRAFPLGSDLNITYGGTIEYFTSGSAPNRKFVINYKDVVFDNNEAGVGNVQMIINEGTNVIEFHTGVTNNVASAKTQGLISPDGTSATLVPGRNGDSVWNGTPDAVRFVPVVPLVVAWSPPASLNSATSKTPTASGITSPTTFTVSVTDPGISCSATGTVSVGVKAAGTWTGAVNGNWSNSGNWCGGVPTASTPVLIPDAASLPASPNISAAASAGSISLENGALLSISSGPLNLYGDITASGTGSMQAAGATLNLARTGSQTLAIPAFTVATLSINNGGVKTLTNDVTITGTLNFSAGVLDIGSQRLALAPGAGITGSSASSYVRTSASGGNLRRQVGATPVLFPVGNTSYNPATLSNSGTTDLFSVGVRDQVLSGGTTGTPVNAATTFAVNRTWDVAETTPGGSNVTMTLGWNSGETNSPGFDYTNVYIAHYTGGRYLADPDYPNLAMAPTAAGYPGPGPYSASCNDITSFSPFTVGSASPVPLPVNLLRMTASNEGARNVVSWASASEHGAEAYVVERSADGAQYGTLLEVAAKGAASEYIIYDEAPFDGFSYYRLRTVDADGTYSFSPIAKAFMRSGGGSGVSIMPNPVRDVLHLKVTGAASGDIQLTDAAGRVLVAGTLQKGTATMSTAGLAPGTYFLRMIRQGRPEILRVTKL